MKHASKMPLLLVVFLALGSVIVQAAPSPAPSNKYASPAPWASPSVLPQATPKPITATAPSPVAEGNSIKVESSVTVRPLCPDFETYKRETNPMQCVRHPAGYECPPGWSCDHDRGGFSHCAWEGVTQIYGDDTYACKWEFCSGY